MKKLLLIALVLTGMNARAQYFQHLYGTGLWDFTSDGVNTVVQGQGYFIVGEKVPVIGGTSSVVASFLDVNGDMTGAPYFNSEFEIIDLGGVVLTVVDAHAFEMDNGNGFGIIGLGIDLSTTGGTRGIFYLQLDASGNPTGITQYFPSNTSGMNLQLAALGGIAESVISGGADVYVTGTLASPTSGSHVFVMKIDVASGGIVWSNLFDIANPNNPARDFANDVIESPWQPAGVDEIAIVGFTDESGSGTPQDGFFLRIDANSGSPLASPLIYGTTSTRESFNSISIANSTAGGGDGYIIAGTAFTGTDNDFWLHKCDQTGNTLWSYTYPYNGTSGPNWDELTGVIERLNTSNQYEYYAVGTTGNGSIGSADVVVLKVDDNGNPVANGQFTYGDVSGDYGIAIDQYNGTSADGLTVFASMENVSVGLGRHDMYIIRAYFNGLSGCNEAFDNFSANNGPQLYNKYRYKHIEKMTNGQLLYNTLSAGDYTLCFNNTITGGSNARTANPNNGTGVAVSPNPMQAASGQFTLEMEAAVTQEVSVTLYDMLGRTYYSKTAALQKGKNSLPLDVSHANLAPGMYTVRISGATISQTVLLQVK